MNSRDFADLTGRWIMVTGGSSGIGRAVCLELARGGANVLVHYANSREAALKTCETIRAQGRQSTVIGCDFGNSATFDQFLQDTWGICESVDGWVHCAGADILTGEGAHAAYAAKLEQLVQVDLVATMLICKDVAQRMRQSGRGSILTIGWDQSDRGMEGDSGELFSAVKNGIMGFTRSLALSAAPEVRVNCIAPGWIQTAWGFTASERWQQRVLRETPLARWGTPGDIAKLARFLISDDASYLTGQVINANGGAVR